MRNILVIILVIFVIAVGGFYFFTQNKSSDQMMRKQDSMMEKSSDSSMMKKSGNSRYVEYSKEVLENSTDKRRVLFFYANWCPICKPADTNFRENVSRIPEDVVLIRVNYNDSDTDKEEKALVEKYGITYQHTFVQIDANGNEVTKWNGGQIDELLSNLK